MKRKNLIIGLIAIIVIGLIFAIIKSRNTAHQPKEVSVEDVVERNIIESVTASGKIYAENEVKISSDVSGEIIHLYVKAGQVVKKGDLLAKIQPETYQAMVDQSEAEYNNALANLKNMQANHSNILAKEKQIQAQLEQTKLAYKRAENLYKSKSISTAEMEEADMTYKTAQAELDAIRENIKGASFSIEGARASIKGAQAAIRDAKSNLLKTSIVAPMSGIISLLNVEEGEKVVGTLQMTGTEIMRITDFSNMEVRVDVSENEIIKVEIGDTANIEVDAYFGDKFKGVVTQVSNTSKGAADQTLSSEQSSNFIVKVRITEDSYAELMKDKQRPFLPGMSATVDIFTKEVTDALSVPIQAVVTREDSTSKELIEVVFLNKSGKAVQAPVRTGIQNDTYIHILKGVNKGDQIISGPYDLLSKSLKSGDNITTNKKEK